jgi:hypothetical protein
VSEVPRYSDVSRDDVAIEGATAAVAPYALSAGSPYWISLQSVKESQKEREEERARDERRRKGESTNCSNSRMSEKFEVKRRVRV